MTTRPLEPGDLDGGLTICGTCQHVIRPDCFPPCFCEPEQHGPAMHGFHPDGTSLGGTPMDWYEALSPRCDGCGELQEDCNCTPSDCDCDSCLERRGYDEESRQG